MSALKLIHQKIQEKGDIPFVEFMQLALYAPGFGYYSSGLQKFGPLGDFVTAPEISSLFGKTIARQVQEVFAHLTDPLVFEFGAGSGKLCVDILTQLEIMDCLPEEYWILEVSGDLVHRQQTLIKQSIPHLQHKVRWISSWPSAPFNGVVIANEVLDAMPVHRFLQTGKGVLECFVGLDDKKNLQELYKPCIHKDLTLHVEKCLSSDLYPYQSEANLFINGWISQVYSMINSGAFFIFDYGFPRHEYYHPQRNTGTLMCHYQQTSHTNPLAHPGEEDITAHVDFTHVAEAADAAGFHVAGFVNQASFLLMNGILELLGEGNDLSIEKVREQQAVKKLLQPHEMGELFKVMLLTKNFDYPLKGFQLHDKRANL